MYRSLLLYTLLTFCFLPSLAAQTSTGSFEYDGQLRDYRLYVPVSYDGTQAWPLVFNLHGYTSNAIEQEFYTQMNFIANTRNFIVCYPNGIDNAWNAGGLIPGANADDVGFIDALIDTLSAQYLIDPERIFSCGMSNGGFMSFKLACDLGDRFAAVASVTGSMVPAELDLCLSSNPMPVLQIHGTEDPVVPYGGMFNSVDIPTLIDYWVEKNACVDDPEIELVPNVVINDESTAVLYQYNDCTEETEVWHYKVINGEHTWPGAPIGIGVTNQDFSASLAIWEFFLRHSPEDPSAVKAAVEEGLNISAFPNPFSSELSVQVLGVPSAVVSLWDQWGRLVWRGEVEGRRSIDTGNWPSGNYWIVSSSGREILSSSLLIRH